MRKIEVDGEVFLVPEEEGDSWYSQRCPSCQKRNFMHLSMKYDAQYFVCGFCASNVLMSNEEDFLEELEDRGSVMPEDGVIHYNIEGDEI